VYNVNFGKHAVSEVTAKYPQLWKGLMGYWCVSKTPGTSGISKVPDLSPYKYAGTPYGFIPTNVSHFKNGMALNYAPPRNIQIYFTKIEAPLYEYPQYPWNAGWSAVTAVANFKTTSSGCIFGRDYTPGAAVHADRGWMLKLSSGALEFFCFGTGATYSYCITSPSIYNDGREHQVVGVFDVTSPTIIRLYVDGSEVAYTRPNTNFAGTSIRYAPTTPVTIGMDASQGNKFTGDIGDCFCYNRVLSPSEIKLLYENKIFERKFRTPLAYGLSSVPEPMLGTWTSPIFMPKKKQTIFPNDIPWENGIFDGTEVNGDNQVVLI